MLTFAILWLIKKDTNNVVLEKPMVIWKGNDESYIVFHIVEVFVSEDHVMTFRPCYKVLAGSRSQQLVREFFPISLTHPYVRKVL